MLVPRRRRPVRGFLMPASKAVGSGAPTVLLADTRQRAKKP